MTEILAELLERCKKGEQSAFAVLVKRFQPKAMDLAQAILKDRRLAEDAVQAAFLIAFCRLSQLRNSAAFAGWFRQIVRNESLRIIRKNKSGPDENISFEKELNSSPTDNVELKELQRIVRRALSELPETNRETAELFYLDEQKCSEVAETLDVPLGTVKRRLHDARRRLRNMLLGYIEEPPAKPKPERKEDNRMPL